MTSVAVSAIAIVIGIAVFIFLAYKGLSPILACLIAAVIIGITCEGGVMTAVFDTFMNQAITFLGQILLLIVIGGLLSAVLEVTHTTDALANGIIRILGKNSIPIIIFVMTGLLCFLGVGSYQFIVAPMALGLLRKANLPRNIGLISMMVAYNAVTYCLPGTSVTPNILPTTILGTNIYAGAGVGIFAFVLATGLGIAYVYWMLRDAKKKGLAFEADTAGAPGGFMGGPGPQGAPQEGERKDPPFWTAIVTVVLLFVLCFIFSLVKAFGFDATTAVILAQLITAIWALVVNFKYVDKSNWLKKISMGTAAVIPLAVMLGFIAGFGAVVRSTAAFQALLSGIMSMHVNPYLLTFIGVAVLSACMGNGTGALAMVLAAISPTLAATNANPGAVHRIATVTASTLDSMPHCTNVCVSLQVFGTDHKKSYKYVFMSTVVIPVIYAALTTILCMIVY